jgi:hypothetical protein
MSRRRILAAAAAASLAVGLASAAAAYAASPRASAGLPASAQGAVLGHISAGSAHYVNLRNVPQTTSGLNAHPQPALGRDGKPAGSGLPVRPSSGSKPAPAAAPDAVIGPKIIDTNFNGIQLSTSDCGCQPPDSNATIGPNDILETVNLEFAVYNKSGTLLYRTSLNNFLGTTESLSDPRAVYDPTWNRWEFSLLEENTPGLWLVYSQSSDPLGGWWFYHVNLGLSGVTVNDYPQVGMNDVSFFYTTNNFGSSGYVNSTAFSLPKSRVYNGFGWGASLAGVAYDTTPSIVSGYPTQQTSDTYMLAPDDANNVMYVYDWRNTAEKPSLTYKGSIAYNWAAPPRQVNQPGTTDTLDPLDGRIVWAVSQLDGRLWFAHTVAIGSFPGVDYGFVLPGNMTIHVNSAYHSSSSDDWNPSVAAVDGPDGKPHVTVNWAFTDTANNVPTSDVYATFIGSTPPHLAGSPYITGNITTSETRFGDYSSVWPEYDQVGTCAPGEESFVTNEYFGADGTWHTRLARVHGTC